MDSPTKWTLVFLIVALLSDVDCLNKNKRNKEVMPHATKCFKKFHPPQDDIKRAISGGCMKSSEGKLLMLCTLDDMGFITKEGTANMDVIKKFIGVVASNKQEKIKLEKSVQECNKKAAASTKTKMEDKVADLCQCMHSVGAF